MPHFFDFDTLEQKLFVLQHLCYGSRQYCERAQVHRLAEKPGELEWWEYYGLLKSTVSSTVIESAIKFRMVQDFAGAEQEDINLAKLDRESCEGLTIGKFHAGSGPLTLRESWNKVVHATEARLQWRDQHHAGTEIEFWDGSYNLWGSKGKEEWHVELYIEQWCIAMLRFNKAIQVSVDWHHVSKWDE